MDLETFIAETLRQIVNGVQTAQLHEDCKEARINSLSAPGYVGPLPKPTQVDFDVAITVSEGTEKQGKGNIGVASYFGIGGQARSTTGNSSVSRIKFSIPVVLPMPKE